MKQLLQKPLIPAIIVLAALLFVLYQVMTRPPIDHEKLSFPTRSVEVIRVQKLPFSSRAIGYGNVEPAVLLKAKTEVSGKVSYVHPSLKQGASLPKGTLVVSIEPTTFEFTLEQSKAGLEGNQSFLKQLEVEEISTRRSLDIAKQNLQNGEKELARLLQIWDKRLIARSAVDAEEQKVLQLRQQVEELQGKLASFSSRKSGTKSQIQQAKTQLAQSQDTLGRTEIRLPFDARIGKVSVEQDEFVAIGNQLFEALGTQAVEINAQLPISQFYPLVMELEQRHINLQTPAALQTVVSKIQLQAQVSLVKNEWSQATWHGELLRIGESIDPDRDTIGLVVVVNNPYQDVIPGIRPPLLKGMYAAVEFSSPLRERLVIPRKALHQGRVYVANADNSLEIRPVSILHKQGPLVVIDQGLAEGEKIIITDVIPVIEGLPLAPVVATDYERQLAQQARGNVHAKLRMLDQIEENQEPTETANQNERKAAAEAEIEGSAK